MAYCADSDDQRRGDRLTGRTETIERGIDARGATLASSPGALGAGPNENAACLRLALHPFLPDLQFELVDAGIGTSRIAGAVVLHDGLCASV